MTDRKLVTRVDQIPDEVSKAIYSLFEEGYLESIGLHPQSIAAAVINAWPKAGPLNFEITGPIITNVPANCYILPLVAET